MLKANDTDVFVIAFATFSQLQTIGLHEMWLALDKGKYEVECCPWAQNNSESSNFFLPTPTPQILFFRLPTPQNMPGLPTQTPKTCLSYNKIIVIFKGSESAY